MSDIGFFELLVVALVALLVLGPERLPKVIKKVASWTARGRYFANHLRDEFEREANLSEMRESLNKEKEQFRQHLKQFEIDATDISTERNLENSVSPTLGKSDSVISEKKQASSNE